MTTADHQQPRLPEGAVTADTPDVFGGRVVFGPRCVVDGVAVVRASAIQLASGAIVDDPAEESPSVNLWLEDGVGPALTSAQARQLARHLMTAAGLVDDWRLDAAIARGGARLRADGMPCPL